MLSKKGRDQTYQYYYDNFKIAGKENNVKKREGRKRKERKEEWKRMETNGNEWRRMGEKNGKESERERESER